MWVLRAYYLYFYVVFKIYGNKGIVVVVQLPPAPPPPNVPPPPTNVTSLFIPARMPLVLLDILFKCFSGVGPFITKPSFSSAVVGAELLGFPTTCCFKSPGLDFGANNDNNANRGPSKTFISINQLRNSRNPFTIFKNK